MMDQISIFNTDGRPWFTSTIAAKAGDRFKSGDLEITTFANGEHSPVFMESVRGRKVFLVGSTDTDANIMKMMLSIDAAKRASAKEIIAVIPFFGYARQDRKDSRPEHFRSSIGASTLAIMLEAVGVSQVVTVDLHAEQVQGFFRIPVNHIESSDIIAKRIRKEFGDNNLVLCSPDAGGTKRVTTVMNYMNETTDMAMISKQRGPDNKISAMVLVGDVENKDVIIVDDMIDSAGTLVKAAELIKSKGARSVHAVATHGIFTGEAHNRIENSPALSSVIVMNTLNQKKAPKIKTMNIEYLLAKYIAGITFSESISQKLSAPFVI
jgi:ribose-phosphate pyrophosphokinase